MDTSTALMPSSAGSRQVSALGPPALWLGCRPLHDGGLLRKDRVGEAAVRAAMPPHLHLHGCERTPPYPPRPDMAAADREASWRRMLHQKRTHCSWIAPAQRAETDAFYMLCQQHRDQLRDHSGRLHPLDFFDVADRPFHCPADLFTTYRRYPVSFTRYRQPQAQPLTFGRTIDVPPLPARSLVGDYSPYSDTQWKGQSKAMFT